ncbi:F-box protein [Sesbania bispinosa]|nr:F-box protein [Sesbania bispinosa]
MGRYKHKKQRRDKLFGYPTSTTATMTRLRCICIWSEELPMRASSSVRISKMKTWCRTKDEPPDGNLALTIFVCGVVLLRFYCPTRGTKIVEAIYAKFLENDMGGFDISIGDGTSSNKEQIVVPIPIVQERVVYQPIERAGEVPRQEVMENVPPPAFEEPIENPPLRRSQRERRPVNLDDYYTFLGESDFNIGCMLDSENYKEAISSVLSDK